MYSEKQSNNNELNPEENLWKILLSIVLLITAAGAVQLFVPYPYDTDTAFHAAVGKLISRYGIFHSFPWTPYSYISDSYADKEFLFHLMFAALPDIGFTSTARIVGTVAGASALLSIYYVLYQEKVRHAGIWAFLPLVTSYAFLFRFAIVRPHLLSIALSLLLLWAMARNRFILIAIISFLYPWSYVAFWQLPLMIIFAAESARYFSEGNISWKPTLIVVAGVSAGVLCHPYTLNLIKLNWIQTFNVLVVNAWGGMKDIDLGREFLPPSLKGWVGKLLVGSSMAFASIYLYWRNRKGNVTQTAFTIAACIFIVLTAKTSRFVEYFIPFTVAAFALNLKFVRWKLAVYAVLCVSLVYMLFSIQDLKSLRSRTSDMPPRFAEFLQANVPVGAQVFTPSWKFTGPFMLLLPERRFMVALDPSFFYIKDPELYKLWYKISNEAPPDTPELICSRFHSRYVLTYSKPELKSFIYRLYNDKRVKTLLATNVMFLFDLGSFQECGSR